MKNYLFKVLFFFVLFFGMAMNTQAAVTDLLFDYGTNTEPDPHPTTWVQKRSPDSISYEYKRHQETYNFHSGEYAYFAIGLVNIDGPCSVFIDNIELTGPSGTIPIFNSGFENGTSGWEAWGSRDIEGVFSISSEAYEGSNAAKLTVSNSGSYAIHGQVPIAITQSGEYILSVYTKVYEAEREIPPDEIFAMEVGNEWLYDSNVKREVIKFDTTTFKRDTFEMILSVNGIEFGREWYEVWQGYLRFWGVHESVLLKFGFCLLGGWFPASVSDHKESMAWVINYGVTVDLTADVLGIEPVILNFDTLDAYRLRYNYELNGPGGTDDFTYDWWIVPYIGVVKSQGTGGTTKLISFAVYGGNITETSDNDNDGLLGYKELITYNTDPNDSDSDDDGFSDGDEINTHGTDPNDPNSHPSRPMPWIMLLIFEE